MHVLFAIDTWALIGGTERHAAVVVPALVERGHRVTVLCRESRAGGLADVPVIEEPGLEGTDLDDATRVSLGRRVRGAAPDVIFVSALRNVDALEELADAGPVVRYVHDHTLFCPGLNKVYEGGETCHHPMGVACLKRYWFGGGCICFKKAQHANRILDPIRELRRKAHELEVTRRATRVLTNSEYMRRELLQVGFPAASTSVLSYFTRSNTPDQPPGPLPEATRAFLDAGAGPLLFTPARLTLPDKGVDYLITALGLVQAPWRAVVAGSGPAEEWLRAKAAEEGLGDRLHFTGWMDGPGIETLYGLADVVICPSVWDEPFGLVGIEAMTHGKPVVAFRVGGIPEWLEDGRTGYLHEPRDVEGMARSVDRLLEDPATARALGAEGRAQVATKFGRDRHVEGLEAALRSAAGS